MKMLIFLLLPFGSIAQSYSLSLTAMYDIVPRFGVTGVMEEQGMTLQSSILVGNDFYFQTKMGVTMMTKKKSRLMIYPLYLDLKWSEGIRTPTGIMWIRCGRLMTTNLGVDLGTKWDYSINASLNVLLIGKRFNG